MELEPCNPDPGALSSTLPLPELAVCHKARIFSLLTKLPVVRAWKSAICDGALYLSSSRLSMSYADRYFRADREKSLYVTFSIVTMYKQAGIDRT